MDEIYYSKHMKYLKHYIYPHQTSICRDDIDIEIDCGIELYRGSNSTDDPSDILVQDEATVAEDVICDPEGRMYTRGDKILLTAKEKKEIEEHYEVTK